MSDEEVKKEEVRPVEVTDTRASAQPDEVPTRLSAEVLTDAKFWMERRGTRIKVVLKLRDGKLLASETTDQDLLAQSIAKEGGLSALAQVAPTLDWVPTEAPADHEWPWPNLCDPLPAGVEDSTLETPAGNAQEGEAIPPPGEAGDAPTNSPDAPPSAPPAIPGPPPTHAVLVLEANGQGTIGVVLVAEAFQVPPGAQPDLMHLQMPFVLRHAYHMKEYRKGDETDVKPFGPFELLVNEGNVRNALQDEAKAFQEWTVMAQRIIPAQGPLPEGPMPPGGPRGPYGRPLRGRPRPRR